jgi:hypothetical protein
VSWIFEPSQFIDRAKEQELFIELVELQDEARVLAIRDSSNAGKSQLLKALRWECQFRDPPVPVSLVPLDQIEHKSAHQLVLSLETALRNFDCEFARFREVEEERSGRRLGAIGRVEAGSISGGDVSGVKVEPGAVAIFNSSGEISFDLQEQLKLRAVDAFLEDLREVCKERPVVILLDAYEQCGRDLEQWIPLIFLRKHVFDPDVERLIVVIAGQRVPTAGLQKMLGDRFERIVKPLDSLSTWEREHIRQYLDLEGIEDYDDADVDLLYEKLKAGLSIGAAVAGIQQWKRQEAAA